MYCWKCGKNIRDDSKFCSECGSVVSEHEEIQYPPRRYDPPETQPPINTNINAENIYTQEPQQAPEPKPQTSDEELERFAKKLSKPASRKKSIITALASIAGVIAVIVLVALVQTWIEQGKLANDYAKAQEEMDSGDYSSALYYYEKLGDYRDSEAKLQECQTGIKYKKADSDYNSGLYYSAYNKFTGLGDYKDSAARVKTCKQPYPETGIIFQETNDSGGIPVKVTVSAPEDGYYTYLRIYHMLFTPDYSTNEQPVCTVFIAPGETVELSLRSNAYTFKEAYGTVWYGEQEMFGDDGTYLVLDLNEGSSVTAYFDMFTEYTFTLRTENGNMDAFYTDYKKF